MRHSRHTQTPRRIEKLDPFLNLDLLPYSPYIISPMVLEARGPNLQMPLGGLGMQPSCCETGFGSPGWPGTSRSEKWEVTGGQEGSQNTLITWL